MARKVNKPVVRIRKFRNEDAAVASRIVRLAHQKLLSLVYARQVVTAFVKSNTPIRMKRLAEEGSMFVAEEVQSGKVVGVISARGEYIRRFFVHPRWIGLGVGSKLYSRLEKWSIEHGIKMFKVKSSLNAEEVYKKFGFKRIRKLRMKAGRTKFDVILLKKKL